MVNRRMIRFDRGRFPPGMTRLGSWCKPTWIPERGTPTRAVDTGAATAVGAAVNAVETAASEVETVARGVETAASAGRAAVIEAVIEAVARDRAASPAIGADLDLECWSSARRVACRAVTSADEW